MSKPEKFGLFAVDITRDLGEECLEKFGRVFEISISDCMATNCCELPLSYYLEPVEYQAEKELDDDLHEELLALLIHAEGGYYHVTRAMKLQHKVEPAEDYDFNLDSFREQHHANPDFYPEWNEMRTQTDLT